MAGFKQVQVMTAKGEILAFEPVVLTFPLALGQREIVNGATGHYPSHIELTASELRAIIEPKHSTA